MLNTLLSLPSELRVIIYHHAFANRRLRFARDVFEHAKSEKTVGVAEIDDCTALLVCCKTIYHEAPPIFYSLVRINVDGILHYANGLLHCSATDVLDIDRKLIHHISIDESMFSDEGAHDFVDSLPNLDSLTYHWSTIMACLLLQSEKL